MRSMLIAGLTGAAVAVLLVAAFLALDKHSLHWYAGADDSPTFTSKTVENLTESAIADGAFQVPTNTHFVKCSNIVYIKKNRKWLVTCEFRETSGATPIGSREFVFDDRAGQVEAATK